MIQIILAALTMIPKIGGFVESFTKSYYDAKVRITTAQIGGNVEIAKTLVTGVVQEGQVRVSWLQTMASSKALIVILLGFALPLIAYEWKVVVYDNIISTCEWSAHWYPTCGFSTEPIRGLVADWAGVILAGIFGTGSVLGIGAMVLNRKS